MHCSDTDAHRRKVDDVVRQLRAHAPGRPVSIKKRVCSHQVPKPRDRRYSDDVIDVSALDDVIVVDPEAQTCTAEAGVTFEDLVDETLRFGLVPVVVPELPTITIGGAVSGCSLESMSFRYGGFHDSCLEYEIITARGEVLRCTPDNEHRLLFEMMHGSFGTLGILSQLTFRLVPAKPFVHVTYEHYSTLAAFKDAIWRRFVAQDVDFVDGMIHSPTHYVLAVGRFVDDAPYVSRYDWVRVYYQSTARLREDWLDVRGYFFRYDHGVTNVHPRSKLARLLLGKLVGSHELLTLADRLHRFLPSRPSVVVDIFAPFSRAEQFLEWYEREQAHYPVWCVPYRRVKTYEWIAPQFLDGVQDELFLDLAIYGMKQRRGRNHYRELEQQLLEVRGIKTLISYNYYDEDTFWRIFNEPSYRAAKAVVDPAYVFRDLYSKTCRAPLGLDDVPPRRAMR